MSLSVEVWRPRRGLRVGALAAALLLAAPFGCDGGTPIDPCDRDLACAVAGVDIAILDVTPLWTDEQEYDASVDRRVVQPGDEIAVEVLVMNRGTIDAAHPATLAGYLRDVDGIITDSVEVAPLAVGERATYTLVFEVPTGPRFVRYDPLAPAYEPTGLFVLHEEGYVDENPLNDRRVGGIEFLVDAPVLELRLDGLPDTMRAQVQYTASLVVRNHSDRRPYGGGLVVEFCATYFGLLLCEDGEADSFSPVTVGPIPVDAERTFPASLRFDKDALQSFDEAQDVAIAPCVEQPDRTRECMHPPDFDILADYDVVALPNLLVDCDPAALADGAELNVADALCDHDAGIASTYAVVSFAATAGECWRADFTTASSGSIALKNAETLELLAPGSPDCALVQRSGTQLVVVSPSTPGGTPSGTILLERIP